MALHYPDKERLTSETRKRWGKLHDFRADYDAAKFLSDLENYFEGEVDFDIEKINSCVGVPGCLEGLIEKAKANNTHPVSEFIKGMMKDLSK
jgi:hypothetical protein